MAKGKKAKSSAKRERRERRFLPESAGNPLLVKVLGGVGAASLGAGAWAQFGRSLMGVDLPPYAFAPYVLGAGALLLGSAVWLGTTSEPPVRVGAGGLAIEKSELVRIPWHAIERIVWEPERGELSVRGKDENGKEVSLTLGAKTHPLAAAWLAREALARIPEVTDIPDEVSDLRATRPGDGESMLLEPLQVVGRHCAASGRIIAYEPDARVCPRCELVYHKLSVPEECACGASLTSMRAAGSPPNETASLAEAGTPVAGHPGGTPPGPPGEPATDEAPKPDADAPAKDAS
jgi:hypothetical protein